MTGLGSRDAALTRASTRCWERDGARVIVRRLGRVSYEQGLELQDAARRRVLDGGPDELLLLEHDPVVTLGKRGGEVDRVALERLETPVVQTDRGGFATWHGPGQLVGYPIVDVRRLGEGVPGFVARLGEAMARTAQAFGVEGAAHDPERPGVYVEGRKLGSIGLHVHRGVTSHGLALNVCCGLEGFAAIVPCGYRGLPITTLWHETGRSPTVDDAADQLLDRLLG